VTCHGRPWKQTSRTKHILLELSYRKSQCFFFHNFSLPLFALTFILTSVAFVLYCKYLFELVTGTILEFISVHAVYTVCAINLSLKETEKLQNQPVEFQHLQCECRDTKAHVNYLDIQLQRKCKVRHPTFHEGPNIGSKEGWVFTPTPPAVLPGTHRTGVWVGTRVCLDGCGKSRPPQPGFDPRTVQPVAGRYTDRVIAARDFSRRIHLKFKAQ
jgi:hypothetical protein